MDARSEDLRIIVDKLIPEFIAKFTAWNAEYPTQRVLGVRAEYVEMHRKVIKLKPALLDGEAVRWRESPRTVVMELIGHAFLALVDLTKPEAEQGEFADTAREFRTRARQAVPRLPEDEEEDNEF